MSSGRGDSQIELGLLTWRTASLYTGWENQTASNYQSHAQVSMGTSKRREMERKQNPVTSWWNVVWWLQLPAIRVVWLESSQWGSMITTPVTWPWKWGCNITLPSKSHVLTTWSASSWALVCGGLEGAELIHQFQYVSGVRCHESCLLAFFFIFFPSLSSALYHSFFSFQLPRSCISISSAVYIIHFCFCFCFYLSFHFH